MRRIALLIYLLPAIAAAQPGQNYNGPSVAQIDAEIADADATIGQLIILKAKGTSASVEGVILSMQAAKQKLMEMRDHAAQAGR
jgi:hypothetical protein